jgi:hypothetical protein
MLVTADLDIFVHVPVTARDDRGLGTFRLRLGEHLGGLSDRSSAGTGRRDVVHKTGSVGLANALAGHLSGEFRLEAGTGCRTHTHSLRA